MKKKKHEKKEKKEEPLVRTKIPKNFFMSSKNSNFANDQAENKPLIIDAQIDLKTLESFTTQMQERSYIIHDQKKYWLPHTRKVLNAVTNAQK